TVEHLLTLNNLTHLAGFLTHKFLQLNSTSQVVEPFLKRLAALPKLKFVQVLQSDYTRVWVEIIRRPTSGFRLGGKRRGNAKYAGYRIVPDSRDLTKSRFNMDGTGWGEFYNGLV
ncbi:MAG TPA: hypothetical protein VGO47_11800, partial [Chlamydiales bacterium]|nr:hypothetical protein [Chlamydiales bacterium]